MPIVPKRVNELLDWALAHGPTWSAAAPQIGLSPEDAQRFAEAAEQAAAQHAAGYAAMEAARAAQDRARAAVEELRRTAAEMLLKIKATAAAAGSGPAAVYAAAQIPPPLEPAPAGPPGLPHDFKALLNPDGSISLRWSCRNPRGTTGTVYTVRRRVALAASGPAGEWETVAAVGRKTVTDSTVPAGAAAVEYSVQGQRGQSIGPISAPFTVQFGTAEARSANRLAA